MRRWRYCGTRPASALTTGPASSAGTSTATGSGIRRGRWSGRRPPRSCSDEFAAGNRSESGGRTRGRPTMTDDADLQLVVAAELLTLADLLEEASEVQWDTPSLCEGWRVREVIAHMTMAARYSQDAFMAELARHDFDFGRLSNEIAAQDAGLPTGELVASLRSDVMQHWAPPGG